MKKRYIFVIIILVIFLLLIGLIAGTVVIGGSLLTYHFVSKESDDTEEKSDEPNVEKKKEESPFKIVIEWDGRYSDDNTLIDLDIILSGTLNGGTAIVLDDSIDKAYNASGKLVGTMEKMVSNNKGTITIELFEANGTFSIEGRDGRYNPQLYDNEISYTNGKATVMKNGEKVNELDVESGLCRSYTGYWFWGICGIEDGELVEYDSSWITNEYQDDTYEVEEYFYEIDLSEEELEERIEEIREVYYGIQNNISAYTEQDGGSNTVRYLKDGQICKIVAKAGAYADQGYDSKYTAQYYYDDEQVVFVFVYSGDEEYRFYMDTFNCLKVIRYIDSDGVIHDYAEGADATTISDVGFFCEFAMLEMGWAHH